MEMTRRQKRIKALEELYKRRAKAETKAKPLCPYCRTENSYEQYLGTHAPHTIYQCKKCERGFFIKISLSDGAILNTHLGEP